MSRLALSIMAMLVMVSFLPSEAAAASVLTSRIADILRDQLAPPQTADTKIEVSADLSAPVAVADFYARRNFRPAWLSDAGPMAQAIHLIKALQDVAEEGLRPQDYHQARLQELLSESLYGMAWGRPPEDAVHAALELLLTDAFLAYGSHQCAGRVNPSTVASDWLIEPCAIDLPAVLDQALLQNRIAETLAELRPAELGYRRLLEAYGLYRDVAENGGWPLIAEGPLLRQGERDERLPALRCRLAATGDLRRLVSEDPDFFDEDLREAVRLFQRRHGLKDDGVIGPATLAVLNVTAAERARQIGLNLERWRWLPADLGPRYILVNIADFQLRIVEENQTTLTMKVVVGKDERRTPILSGNMTYLAINPFWNIPQKLARDDILPSVWTDPEFLSKHAIRVYDDWSAQAAELDAESIDWAAIEPSELSYRLRQDPGPTNALGRIKFMFPNAQSVYLHDTPSRYQFRRARRSYSSGCVRVEKPVALAEYLLKENTTWTRRKILKTIADQKTVSISLPRPMPVHILYWTAWVDEDELVHFREDIYEQDMPLEMALQGLSEADQQIVLGHSPPR